MGVFATVQASVANSITFLSGYVWLLGGYLWNDNRNLSEPAWQYRYQSALRFHIERFMLAVLLRKFSG